MYNFIYYNFYLFVIKFVLFSVKLEEDPNLLPRYHQYDNFNTIKQEDNDVRIDSDLQVKYVKTRYGNTGIVYKNYFYYCVHINKHTLRWRCRRGHCKARLSTSNGLVIGTVGEHNHNEPNLDRIF